MLRRRVDWSYSPVDLSVFILSPLLYCSTPRSSQKKIFRSLNSSSLYSLLSFFVFSLLSFSHLILFSLQTPACRRSAHVLISTHQLNARISTFPFQASCFHRFATLSSKSTPHKILLFLVPLSSPCSSWSTRSCLHQYYVHVPSTLLHPLRPIQRLKPKWTNHHDFLVLFGSINLHQNNHATLVQNPPPP